MTGLRNLFECQLVANGPLIISFAVADDAGEQKFGVVEGGAEGV